MRNRLRHGAGGRTAGDDGGRRFGFSLIELLVVIAIIALLLGILVPSLQRGRQQARMTVCQGQLRGLMTAHLTYAADHHNHVVPSYNMRGVSLSSRPLDGWGPILDKGGYAEGNERLSNNLYVCPETTDVAGMERMDTEDDPRKRQGYMDWPAVLTLSRAYARTIPSQGYERIIRVGYWINGENPIGIPRRIRQGIFFTGSAGYGPDPQGNVLQPNDLDDFVKPFNLIALTDGLYAGEQQNARMGFASGRVGYRHPGRVGQTNAGFVDGHVGSIEGDRFPRIYTDQADLDEIRSENLGGPTLYANPQRDLQPGRAYTPG